MSNFSKAFQVCLSLEMDDGDTPSAMDYVRTLREAGLLAPDLPEDYREGIFKVSSPHLDVRSVQAAGDQIVLHGYKTRHASIEESRRLALAILAAADYAEKEQGNE